MRLPLAIVLLSASLSPVAASAQAPEERGGIELKPAVGLTFTGVTSDPATGDASAQAGWQVGGTLLFGEKLYLEGGAFYARKSTDITAVSAAQSVDFAGVSGVRIPVMLGYHLLSSARSPVALRAFGGASVFLVTSVDAEGLSKSDFESPSWGVFAGAGVDVAFLFVDLKYEWSLTDVTNVSAVDVGQSRSIYVNAGVKLHL